MQPDSAYTEVNDINLHYLTWQPPSGGHVGLSPLLLLHPTGFLARTWQPVAEALAQPQDGSLGHRVYAPDMRGHGDSDKPATGYHWQTFVDDLRAFLDRLILCHGRNRALRPRVRGRPIACRKRRGPRQ